MDLLIQLGVNKTLAYQFVIFLVVFVALKYVLFEPYFAAFIERKDRTLGKTELAERFVAEAIEMDQKFGQKAQEANDRYREIFDKSRTEAMHEYDQVIGAAREKTKLMIEKNRKEIQTQMIAARVQLAQEVGAISQLINTKLIGKDLSA